MSVRFFSLPFEFFTVISGEGSPFFNPSRTELSFVKKNKTRKRRIYIFMKFILTCETAK
jgi:hypothetical protein